MVYIIDYILYIQLYETFKILNPRHEQVLAKNKNTSGRSVP